MKKQDLIKQLANRINQPHVIESWINKIEKASYNKGYKDAESKQCNIPVVVNQRELLHTEVFKLANKLAINGYGNEAVKMHQICNGM